MEGWDMSERWRKKAGKQARLGEEIKLKIIELDVPLKDAIEVLEAVKITCTNVMRSAKKPPHPQQDAETGAILPGRQ